MSARIAVLASGGGTNLQAILDYFDSLGAHAPARVVVVASDRAQAGALDRARRAEIEALPLAREQRGDALAELLVARGVDLIALAGYLRLVPPAVSREWHGRMVNVHPALLPAFGGHGMYGHHVHEAVLRAGARVSGPTVHFVDEEFDKGPIIAQWPVPVAQHDTADSLAARVLRAEHALYPRVVRAIVERRVSLGDDGRVQGALDATREAMAFLPSRNDASLTEIIDALLFD
jgi:formyltetrahydrofolate-dependent phosphoribosylglycinamide formyltransferase